MPTQLDHLIIKRMRESEIRPPQRSPFGASPPLRSEKHRESVARQMHTAVEQAIEATKDIGIEGINLLVLELGFLGIDERQELENRFQASIVSESIPEDISTEIRHEISIHFSNSLNAQEFLRQWTIDSMTYPNFEILPERTNLGYQSDKKYTLRHADKSVLESILRSGYFQNIAGLDLSKLDSKKIRKSQINLFKITVQFSSAAGQQHFLDEAELYFQGNTQNSFLTAIQRAKLFDALEAVRRLSPEDKIGFRLEKQFDSLGDEVFAFDVDLWHPGISANIASYKEKFRSIVQELKGTVPGGPQEIAGSMLVAKVNGTRDLLSQLLTLDMVSWIDLPPEVDFGASFPIDDAITPPDLTKLDLDDLPIAGIIDSGIVSAHPFLAGLVVEARDFDSGEGTPADLHGHGTQVAGIIAYGDLTEGLISGVWNPKVRLLSGKVLRNIASGFGGVVFAEDERASTQMAIAIRTLHAEHGCRVFNISINENSRSYKGGRQPEWALMLDELVRELDIVVVVSAGNVNPEIPNAAVRSELGKVLLNNQLSAYHSISDPASGANVLTVGSIARRDQPSLHPYLAGRDPSPIVPAKPDMPSPFTRVGNVSDKGVGLIRHVKPDLVSYGGNYSILAQIGTNGTWKTNDRNLAEVVLHHEFLDGKLLALGSGTSFAAPYVTHVCAQVEHQLRKIFGSAGKIPSASLVRAVTVHSASIPKEIQITLSEGQTEGDGQRVIRRLMGYGRPSVDRAVFSEDSRVLLIADDTIKGGKFHIYELDLPENFIRNSGRRHIKATLAFDPPVRNTRKAYTAFTMRMTICRGLTPDDIDRIRSKSGEGSTSFTSTQTITMQPTENLLSWSTVQSNIYTTSRAQLLKTCKQPDGKYKIHIIVGCEIEFPGYEDELQRYGLVISLEHEDAQISLYQEIQASITSRVRMENRNQVRNRLRP